MSVGLKMLRVQYTFQLKVSEARAATWHNLPGTPLSFTWLPCHCIYFFPTATGIGLSVSLAIVSTFCIWFRQPIFWACWRMNATKLFIYSPVHEVITEPSEDLWNKCLCCVSFLWEVLCWRLGIQWWSRLVWMIIPGKWSVPHPVSISRLFSVASHSFHFHLNPRGKEN